MSELYDPADARGGTGHAEFLSTQAEYDGPPVPPRTGVEVGEWVDFREPAPQASHEAVCPACFLVGTAALINGVEGCGNCDE